MARAKAVWSQARLAGRERRLNVVVRSGPGRSNSHRCEQQGEHRAAVVERNWTWKAVVERPPGISCSRSGAPL